MSRKHKDPVEVMIEQRDARMAAFRASLAAETSEETHARLIRIGVFTKHGNPSSRHFTKDYIQAAARARRKKRAQAAKAATAAKTKAQAAS